MIGLEYLDIGGQSWVYQLLDKPVLGFGAFGQVYLAQAAIHGKEVRKIAVKKLAIGKTRDYLESELEKKGENSWKYLFDLNHPNILKYYGAHVTSLSIMLSIDLLMEYCSGESLENLLLTRKIPATYTSIYAKQVLEGLRRTDIWSLGCIVLDLVCETYPRLVTIQIPRSESTDTQFRTVERNNYSELEDLLRMGGIPFPVLPKDLPDDLEQFLNRCFTFEHNKRSTAAELLQDPFFEDAHVGVASRSQDCPFLISLNYALKKVTNSSFLTATLLVARN
ncbi:hypothetical protein BV898_04101 [Hypsibius exemplaris]|uniref:Protein kinase domain-containing protein n=1 Tax=Hypsibius exemplaris TaxID=2072580 RepID=A0A1W0X389_HYPEX|nr:hypothetical protein BV898_04101 [Hypsibius exemplaris]